jgi:hypothetical protein
MIVQRNDKQNKCHTKGYSIQWIALSNHPAGNLKEELDSKQMLRQEKT